MEVGVTRKVPSDFESSVGYRAGRVRGCSLLLKPK